MRPQVWSHVGCCGFGWEDHDMCLKALFGGVLLFLLDKGYWSTALVEFPLNSIAAAKHHSAQLWFKVDLACVRLVLQPTRICLRIPGVAHCWKAASSPTRRCKSQGQSRTSYVALMVKHLGFWTSCVLSPGDLSFSPRCPNLFNDLDRLRTQPRHTYQLPPGGARPLSLA